MNRAEVLAKRRPGIDKLYARPRSAADLRAIADDLELLADLAVQMEAERSLVSRVRRWARSLFSCAEPSGSP